MSEMVAGSARPEPPRRDHAMFDAELSGRALNLQLLRRLLHWIRPYRATVALSSVLILVSSALQVMLPVVISVVVVDHVIMGSTQHVTPDMGMIDATQWIEHDLRHFRRSSPRACCSRFCSSVGPSPGTIHRLTLIRAVINGLRDLRLDLFRHLETRPSSFYDRVAVGRIMTRVTNDVEALYELLRGIGTLIGEFVPFFVALVIMLAVDVKLTVIMLLVMPIMGGVTYTFQRITRQLFRLVRQSVSALNQNLQENLAGLQVVQMSQRQQYNEERYGAINARNREVELRSMRIETLYGAFTDSVSSIALALVIWYGAGAVLQEHVSLGGVILFTRFIDMLFHPIVVLGEQTNILFRAMASGERIFQALDWDEKIHEPATPTPLPARLRGEVEFRHVDFGYDLNTPVLRDVSFDIRPGEKLAIVGPTGSGKSTLIRLLGRFYDFEDGQIFLDGIDLNHIHTRDLRRRVGVVLQDFHIFSGTIYDNIALGDPSISRERAIERRPHRQRRRVHPLAARRLRHRAVRARPESLARSAPAARLRARARGRSGNSGARRSNCQHRYRNRTADSGRTA